MAVSAWRTPVVLAEWALRGEDNIRAAMNSDETLQVKLEKPIPVLILYNTAVVMEFEGSLRRTIPLTGFPPIGTLRESSLSGACKFLKRIARPVVSRPRLTKPEERSRELL